MTGGGPQPWRRSGLSTPASSCRSLWRASFCQVAPRNFRRRHVTPRNQRRAVRRRSSAASPQESLARWRISRNELDRGAEDSPVARREAALAQPALSACANSQPSSMEETTIIGYGVLLAVLLFAACGYYCWSESQKSAMVAEAPRGGGAAEGRGAGGGRRGRGGGGRRDGEGWSRVGQQPGGGGKRRVDGAGGGRRSSRSPARATTTSAAAAARAPRAPAGSSAGLMDSDDDDRPTAVPARGAQTRRGGARMSEEERCRRLGTPSPDLEAPRRHLVRKCMLHTVSAATPQPHTARHCHALVSRFSVRLSSRRCVPPHTCRSRLLTRRGRRGSRPATPSRRRRTTRSTACRPHPGLLRADDLLLLVLLFRRRRRRFALVREAARHRRRGAIERVVLGVKLRSVAEDAHQAGAALERGCPRTPPGP